MSDQPTQPFKVAYMMSRFPKLTETFILFELLAVQEQGVQVEIYPLMRHSTNVMHPQAKPLVERAHYTPYISLPLIVSNLKYLIRKPRQYIGTLWTALRATWGCRVFFLGILAFFPKAVYMADLMTQEGIQHIHAHFVNHPAAVAFIIHRLTGIPYSFTAHGSDLHKHQHMLCHKVMDASVAITVSKYNKDVIIQHCGSQAQEKVTILHCGVDIDTFRPELEARTNERFVIICVGTLHEVKGQQYLLEACHLLAERGIDFVCHLVGDGEDREKLKMQVAEAGIADRVVFHGSVPQAEVVNLLKQADIIALPSVPTADGRREGIPVSLMEAMACGLPVVSSRLSGIPELVLDGQTGLLTEPRDVGGIAAAIEKLYHDVEMRQAFGQASRQRIADEFNLQSNAETLIKWFQSKP